MGGSLGVVSTKGPLYKFQPTRLINLMTGESHDEVPLKIIRQAYREEARLTLDKAATKTIQHADKKLSELEYEEGDRIMVKLTRGYKLPGEKGKLGCRRKRKTLLLATGSIYDREETQPIGVRTRFPRTVKDTQNNECPAPPPISEGKRSMAKRSTTHPGPRMTEYDDGNFN